MSINSWIPFLMLIAYMAVVVFLSYRATIKGRLKRMASGETQTFEEYFTAGKSMPGWMVSLIILVTFYSGSTFTGRVGFAFNSGVAFMSAVPSCAMAGVFMYFISEKVWPISRKYRLSTLADLMELRYQNKLIKTFLSAAIVCFNIVWLILEIKTLGMIMNIMSSGAISREVGSLIGFGIIICYAVTGGIKSVAAVDSFSVIIMLGGSFIALMYILFRFYDGSILNIFQIVNEAAPEKMGYDLGGSFGWKYWLCVMLLDTPTGMVYPANYMQMCLAKSTKEIKKTAITTALAGPWLAIIFIMGFGAFGLTTMGVPIADPESSLLEIAAFTGNGVLLGLIGTFIFAAALGTLDSTLMGLSGLVSNDIVGNVKSMLKKEAIIGELGDDKEIIKERVTKDAKSDVRNARIVMVILGIVAYLIGLRDLPIMILLIAYASQGFVQLVPLIAAGLYWKKVTPYGAISGLVAGVGLFVILDAIQFDFFGFWIGGLAVILNIFLLITVSLMTHKKYYADRPQYKTIMRDFFVKDAAEEYVREHFKDEVA